MIISLEASLGFWVATAICCRHFSTIQDAHIEHGCKDNHLAQVPALPCDKIYRGEDPWAASEWLMQQVSLQRRKNKYDSGSKIIMIKWTTSWFTLCVDGQIKELLLSSAVLEWFVTLLLTCPQTKAQTSFCVDNCSLIQQAYPCAGISAFWYSNSFTILGSELCGHFCYKCWLWVSVNAAQWKSDSVLRSRRKWRHFSVSPLEVTRQAAGLHVLCSSSLSDFSCSGIYLN